MQGALRRLTRNFNSTRVLMKRLRINTKELSQKISNQKKKRPVNRKNKGQDIISKIKTPSKITDLQIKGIQGKMELI